MKYLLFIFLFSIFSFGEPATKDDFDFMQSLIYVLTGLVFASPFIAIYLKRKEDSKMREVIDSVNNIISTLRELAQNDDKMRKALKSSHLI